MASRTQKMALRCGLPVMRGANNHLEGNPMKSPCLVAAILLSCASATHAQDFSTRPITIMVGVAPGGVTDLATRAYANAVSKNTGWKVVVENRTGAGGAVAAKAVETAAPDGHTLLTVVGAQFASIPAMQSPPPFDPVRGFQPITLTFRLAQLLAVPAEFSGQHDCRSARARQEEGRWLVVRHAPAPAVRRICWAPRLRSRPAPRCNTCIIVVGRR